MLLALATHKVQAEAQPSFTKVATVIYELASGANFTAISSCVVVPIEQYHSVLCLYHIGDDQALSWTLTGTSVKGSTPNATAS